MQIEYDGFLWTKQKSGYYQRTKRKASGKMWLHQYKYEKEIGAIPCGFCIHHKDHNKDNNEISNLEAMDEQKHREYHKDEHDSGRYIRENNKEMQQLAILAKEGKYIGIKKFRKQLDRTRTCEQCKKSFIPSKKTNDKVKFCSYECQKQYSHEKTRVVKNQFSDEIISEGKICPECGERFYPSLRTFGRAVLCSGKCNNRVYRRKKKEEKNKSIQC